jgi:hypothetical protein
MKNLLIDIAKYFNLNDHSDTVFSRWAPGIAQAVIYAYFTVMFSREYFVSHKPWYYLLLSAVCCLVSAGMISLAIYKTVLEDKLKNVRRAIDEACTRCGGLGYVGLDGDPCPVCHPTDDFGWVADGCGDWIIARVFRRKKRVVLSEDDGSREEQFGVRGYL